MFRLINKLKNKKGFTLIELIVVLAVLAIITAIAVPRFMGVQASAEEKADEATIEMVKKAAELYYVSETNPDETPELKTLIDEGYLEPIKLNNTSITSITINTSDSAIENVTVVTVKTN